MFTIHTVEPWCLTLSEGRFSVLYRRQREEGFELLSHARWRAEREAPKRWGAKQQVTMDTAVTVVLAASDSTGRLIEHEALQGSGATVCLPDLTNEA